MSPRPGTRAAVLRDPKLDKKLHRDGFAVFPLLDPREVESLREAFGRLRGWEGEGFQADLQNTDPAYKRAVRDVLAEALERRVSERFTHHTPFMYNFLCKHPGPDSGLYVHRDWMYVDERAGHRTFVAWIALQDVRADNGRLRVLRGSHRLDSAFRGTELIAPWIGHADVIDERLRSLRVNAGDCVVIDNGLTHSSYPNLTAEPRLVAAVGMRPVEAPLVHFLRSDPHTAVRYDIDETFFLDHTPQDLLAAPPPLPVAETIPDNQVQFTASELARHLDRGARAKADRWARRVAGGPQRARQTVQGLRARAHGKAWATWNRTRAASERLRPARVRRKLRSMALFAPGGHRSAGGGPIRSVLVLASTPDQRPSTAVLRAIVDDLSARPGLRVETWFMTALDRSEVWEGARVLDGPFDTPRLEQIAQVRLGGVGRRLRGIRRLVWLAQVRPDLVIFDDGLGQLLTRRMSRDHVRVLRSNRTKPVFVPPGLEAVVGDPHLAIVSPDAPAPPGVPMVRVPEFFVEPPADHGITAARRLDARHRLGIPDGTPVVVGTGRDGWVDGPDLFLRMMWTLEHRHGVQAHGVWIWHHAAIDELGRLEPEAERCGLAGRMHFTGDLDLRAAADVAFLPYRDLSPTSEAVAFLATGTPVVSFPVWAIDHALLHVVPHLDLDAAAATVARAPEAVPEEGRDAIQQIEGAETVTIWVDQFLAAAAACRH